MLIVTNNRIRQRDKNQDYFNQGFEFNQNADLSVKVYMEPSSYQTLNL